MKKSDVVFINGDGETSRDFCFIENVVQANILAATITSQEAANQVYNIAAGDRTTLNCLFNLIRESLELHGVSYKKAAEWRDFRVGDVRHSQASVEKAEALLGYRPAVKVKDGVAATVAWFCRSEKDR